MNTRRVIAVGRAAAQVVVEVRKQFRDHPGIMDHSEKPDYARVVDICTKTSLRELMTPGILVGGVVAFSASLGEFGAVITFASNIPGETQTLPLALYTALQTPNGEVAAARLAAISVLLGLAGLLASEWIARALRRRFGR